MKTPQTGRVLVLGLGAMGQPMAQRLHDAHLKPLVCDLEPQKHGIFEPFSTSVSGFIDVAATVSIVVCCLVDAAQIDSAFWGKPICERTRHHGFARHLRAGSVVIVTSTISPADMAALAVRLGKLCKTPPRVPTPAGCETLKVHAPTCLQHQRI
jgi:3-hydroxyisobutyrate dehydrogenase-like beta-hydroxyacid dehydrogenase